jgi:hypothetical protein
MERCWTGHRPVITKRTAPSWTGHRPVATTFLQNALFVLVVARQPKALSPSGLRRFFASVTLADLYVQWYVALG